MSNRSTHAAFAIPSGGALAMYQARSQSPTHQLIEISAGLLGGYVGGRLPDLVDPPDSPNHRGIGHSIFSITVAGTIIFNKLSDWQEWFRELADKAKLRAEATADQFLRALFLIAEGVLRGIAGLIAGVIGGYTSHLALDFMTPCSLPLVARGF